jgi:hypothetical protein
MELKPGAQAMLLHLSGFGAWEDLCWTVSRSTEKAGRRFGILGAYIFPEKYKQ